MLKSVYVFLSSSQARQQQQQQDGIVRLAAVPQQAAAAPAPATFRVSQAAGKDELCTDTCYKVGVCSLKAAAGV